MAGQPSNYSSVLLNTLNEQRLNNQNCDLTLISKDQQQFSAHRFLLAASSTYMSETLLTPGVTQVLMDDIDSVTLQVLLDVVYTGALKLPANFQNESDVMRIAELGKAFGIQILVDLCDKYLGNKNRDKSDQDLKAGGDNGLSSVTFADQNSVVSPGDIIPKQQGLKRGRKPGVKGIKKEPLDEEAYGFKRRKYPKLMRGPDGKFHRPEVEPALPDDRLSDGVSGSENEGDEDDYKPPSSRSAGGHTGKQRKRKEAAQSKVRYMRAGKHKWSNKPSLDEILKEVEKRQENGAGNDLSSDEECESDVSLEIDDEEPDPTAQEYIQQTFSTVMETIEKLKVSSYEQVNEDIPQPQPKTDEEIQDWKNCVYCSKFKGRKKGRYNFHLLFCKASKFSCELCCKPFLKEADKMAHQCKKSLEQVVCDICGKVLRDIQSMKLHMDVHNDVKKYPCPHCHKTFRRTTQRSAHIVHVHTKERPHVCEACGARFGLKYELNRHMQRHSEFPSFACGYCDKFFYEKAKLSFHVKHHHSLKTYQESTILAITTSAVNSNEVEIEVHTTPHDMDGHKKAGEILGYIPIPVSSNTDRQHVQTVTAIDQLTQAASNVQQEYVQLTPVSYEGQNYYVYQQ